MYDEDKLREALDTIIAGSLETILASEAAGLYLPVVITPLPAASSEGDVEVLKRVLNPLLDALNNLTRKVYYVISQRGGKWNANLVFENSPFAYRGDRLKTPLYIETSLFNAYDRAFRGGKK